MQVSVRRGVLSAVASLGLCVSTIGGASAAVPGAALGTVSAPVMRRWAATQGGDQTMTAAQAVANATNYDLLVGRVSTYAPYFARMKAANPDLKMISYLNGAYSVPKNQSRYPDSWHLHDRQGHQIRSVVGGNYLMNPLNPLWISDRQHECTDDISGTGWDGCYVDMLGGATMDSGYVTEVPVDPRTGSTWKLVDWVADTARIGSAVKTANPDKMVVVNGLSNGTVYFDPAQGPGSKLLNGTDGGNAQGWQRGESTPLNDFRPPKKWLNDVRMLVDAGRRGKSAMTMTKVAVAGQTQAEVKRWHAYTIASFLLGTNGHQYLFFTTDGDGSSKAPDTPMDHVDPGAPTSAMSIVSGGAYVRHFTSGMAAVNPTTATVRITLPRRMTDLAGTSVTSVILAPHSGDILTF